MDTIQTPPSRRATFARSRDGDGQIVGLLGMYEDSTDRKHAEAARLAQQAALAELSTPLHLSSATYATVQPMA